MSFCNYIPGVAHVKALTHLICNDKEGAAKTMETFHTKTPIVSHLTAVIAKIAGDDKLAEKCWNGGNSSLNALPVVGHVKGLGHYVCGDIEGGNKAMVDATSTTLNMADGLPVVGHTKGLVHYACGDVKGGNKAMKAATRATAVMGAGAVGFLVGGPVGAVTCGVGAGAEWDLITSIVTNRKEANGIAKIIKNPKCVDSYFDAGLSLIGDGLAGHGGGKMVKKIVEPKMGRNAAVGKGEAAAAGREAEAAAAQQLVEDLDAGKISYAEYQQKWNDMKPKVDPVAAGGETQVAAAQQLVEDYAAKKISFAEYEQKLNDMNSKGSFNNAPVDLGDAAVQQAFNDLTEGKISRAEYYDIKFKSVSNKAPASTVRGAKPYPVATSSGYQLPAMKEMAENGGEKGKDSTPSGNQPPQQPTGNNRPNSSTRVMELRQRLTELLRNVRERIIQDSQDTLDFGDEELVRFRQWQRETFHQICITVSELFSSGHSASLSEGRQGRRGRRERRHLVISSSDGSWIEEIEYEVAGQLDINDQLTHQQFPLNPNSSCPTILSARFQRSQLVLSPHENHTSTNNVIYGIRCRLCEHNGPFEINPENNCYINYVGQTTRSVHQRVCGEHVRSVATTINNESNVTEDPAHRPMYEHTAEHFRNGDLSRGTQPREAFQQVIDVIILPIGSDGDLRSWECFWQFFCFCRKSLDGWSQR